MLSIFAPRNGGLAQLARASRHGGKVIGSLTQFFKILKRFFWGISSAG